MKLCLSSQSVDRKFIKGEMDLFAFVDYANRLKLSYVELEDKHFASTDKWYLRDVRARMDKYGIRCANIAFDCSFGYPTIGQNSMEVVRAEKWMDVAIALGCPNFRLFAGWIGGLDKGIGKNGPAVKKSQTDWDNMVKHVKKACMVAGIKGLSVVIENHNHGGFLSSSDDVLKLFAELDTNIASLLLDTGNYVDGITGIQRTIGLATKHIHLKLNSINDYGLDEVYDLPLILGIISGSKFDGFLSMEYEGTQEEFDVLPKVTQYLKRYIDKSK